MSTHRFIFVRHRSLRQSAFFVLGGLLITLQLLMFSSSALAFSPTETSDVTKLKQHVARAGVSMVRLVSTYTDTKTPSNTLAKCTGLGVVVASWQVADNTPNTLVLTDGALVNPNEASCLTSSHPAAKLRHVDVILSSLYGSNVIFPIELPSVQCADTQDCPKGAALLSFNTQHLQPYLDVAEDGNQQGGTQSIVLPLSKTEQTLEMASPSATGDPRQIALYDNQMRNFLTPFNLQLFSSTPQQPEIGTPLVNSAGDLVGMHINAKNLTLDEIKNLKDETGDWKTVGPNSVYDNWKKGIANYYVLHDNATAHQAFQSAFTANQLFQGANRFAAATTPSATGGESKQSTTANSSDNHWDILGFSFSIWQLLGLGGLVLLLLLLVLTSLTFGRAYTQRQRELREEYAEAERRAAEDVQRLAALEAAQRSMSSSAHVVEKQPVAAPAGKSGPLPPLQMSPDLRCPRCGAAVPRDANYCSNCRLVLSPSESGLHLRISPSALNAPPAMPAPLVQASPSPANSIAEQPTLVPSNSSLAEQPTLVSGKSLAEQPTLVSSGSIAEQPTLEIGANNGQMDLERTVQYGVKQVQGGNLGLAVGTRSDPGIKRKYKPNEDSIFALQGVRNGGASTIQFGLFVIADGMGGHANGQDASRRAIQTIVDFMIPKLSKGDIPEDMYSHLLSEAVQHANQAVHQHNMELRADMGTTVTSALVVGNTAYVTNVGDSRTYLYRQEEGLKKVTNDHSVVASLVEAGIIKPDDIYTHPKRNQIYRSLGEKPSVEVDAFTVQLREGDKLLLCSDGLWDMVRDPKIEDILKAPVPDPSSTVNSLIQAAFDGGGDDNVSVIVVYVSENAQRSLVPGFQLLAKPDTVQMPQL